MRKAAKVYEAGESVEGAKPKAVYESHKKCTPGEFGARVKEALSPASIDMNPAGGPGMTQNTALIGGQLANPTPEYAPDRAWDASRAGLDYRRLRHRRAQDAFGNQVIDADISRRRNENEGRNMNQLSAASGLAPHIGAAIGQPLLGAAAGMAGTAIGGLGANKARIDRPDVMQDFQKQKQNYESVTPPNKRTIYQMPFFGKSSNFGARGKEAVKTAEAVKIQAQFPAPTPGIVDYLRTMLATGTVGGGVGALVGAARAPKGKRLRTALGDAAVGGAAGMGFGAGTLGGISTGAAMDSQNNNSGIPAYLGGLGGALGGASAGALAHKIRNEIEDDYDNNDSPLLNSLAKQSSYTGNFLQHYPMAMRYTVPTTTMVGSLLGAGHGALSDSGAMRGAVRGGLMGAGAGAGTVLGGGLVPSVSGDVGFQPGPEVAVPATIGGGVAGGMAGASGGNALYNMLERRLDTERKPRKKEKKEKQSAYGFGSKVADDIYNYPNGLTQRAMNAGRQQFWDKEWADDEPNQAYVGRKVVGGVAGLLGGRGVGRAAEGAMGLAQMPGALRDLQNFRDSRADFLKARQAANNTTGAPTGSYTGQRPANFVPDYKSPQQINQHRDALNTSRHAPFPSTDFQQKPTARVLQGGASFKPPVAPQQSLMPGGKTSAYEFGGKVAAFNWSDLKNPALGGAAVGAMAGGVHGLLSPGEDEDGKKRNRFGAMLRGVVGGGAIGGIGGAAVGHFAPELTKKLTRGVNAGRMMTDPVNYREMAADLKGETLPPQMRIPSDLRRMHNAAQYGYAVDPMKSYYASLADPKPKYTAQNMFDANRADITGEAFEAMLPPVGPQQQ